MNYPYYIVPDVEKYKNLPSNSEEAKQLALKISVNIGDPEVLKRILGERVENQGNSEVSAPKSFDTITAFLDKFGTDVPAAGYMQTAIQEDVDVPSDNTSQAVVTAGHREETLAELMKAHKYEEALKFIEHKNLNNTQKNIYFAHQMRFIKKLIALEKRKLKP